ncbi:phosphatidylinositol-specific phospholipase C domain-containing protein [Streptomyces sp. NPDC020472]|uniref:phosphatidylinositol-specific phospholipase C domain-containing protein n=1 Tax=unclassified Streptomyces TaxID=2593676 RepID=UPI0036A1C33D
MPRTTPHVTGVGPRRRSRPLARLMTVCVALGATLLTPTAAGAAGSTNEDAYRNLGQADRAEWMWGIASDTKLSAMSIPGTHDTLSIHGGTAAATQEDYGDSAQTLTAQLERGIRAVDIRVRVSGNDAFTVHHGVYYQQANFDDVLTKARSFLSAHPTETIVMRLRAECVYEGESSTPGDCAHDPKSVTRERVRTVFDGYRSRYSSLFYTPSVSGAGPAAIPTLGQVRGKVVLGSFDNADSDHYGIKGFNDFKEDHWGEPTIPGKWNHVKANVDKAMASPSPNDLFLTYSSASQAPFGYLPWHYAGGDLYSNGVKYTGVNVQLMQHLNSTRGRVGIVMSDFPGWGLVNAIIDHNADNAVQGGNRMIWLVNDNKTYVNSLYGRCMVRGPEFDSSRTGGLVTQRECQSTPPGSHQWGAEKPSYDGKGHFWIKASNGKCLTVPYNNGTPPGSGTQLFWWDCETRWFSGSQMWNIIPTKLATPTGSRPAYTFINNWTGLCLSMDPATAGTTGGKVTQETCPKR